MPIKVYTTFVQTFPVGNSGEKPKWRNIIIANS